MLSKLNAMSDDSDEYDVAVSYNDKMGFNRVLGGTMTNHMLSRSVAIHKVTSFPGRCSSLTGSQPHWNMGSGPRLLSRENREAALTLERGEERGKRDIGRCAMAPGRNNDGGWANAHASMAHYCFFKRNRSLDQGVLLEEAQKAGG